LDRDLPTLKLSDIPVESGDAGAQKKRFFYEKYYAKNNHYHDPTPVGRWCGGIKKPSFSTRQPPNREVFIFERR
jgi:hypothetical protein